MIAARNDSCDGQVGPSAFAKPVCWIHGNVMADNGGAPAQAILDAGYDGADLLWDLSGYDNSWDQPGASRLPYALPGKEWSELRRRANDRLWRLLAAITD